ncbi:DEAD/DEAH box helicase [Actinocorallia longicatena]|uniref:DEAD/DEAH box helicase n=1 Tax=Actinocorallia longicatena TaxID=111803 RepID=A0ABP6Q612_9ACTN
MSSPAERYAAHKRNVDQNGPALREFRGLYDFELDGFQLEACRALEGGDGVLVAAPTGSGKTVVGEFAVHMALREGRKCFYTTPIKALSNQKYGDLAKRYGARNVGLLTGDNSVNGEAPIVVMTTEVLRNMLYAGSQTLANLAFVVMDEVHYLADRFRGAVWEEVIIHLQESVRVVALSATVSNAEEFGEWLQAVRGDTTVIVDEHRPVPLFQHMLVGHRLYDLFVDSGKDERAKVNPELRRISLDDVRKNKINSGRRTGRRRDHRPQRFRPPMRADVIERLDREGLLPAITFIFSRAGCQAAVEQCLHSGLRLISREDSKIVRELAEERTHDIPEADKHVLGYYDWLAGLERGLAAHHAGMLPVFKEVVEELFARNLIKAVFATETLALGVNMPARTVVIEKLDKWNGEAHVDLTPGEYTQLTGRAGRRGIDVEGHAVVIYQPGMDPGSVAGLASTRTYPLNSSFRPSYNMAANLVGAVGRERAATLLEESFAQFQADRAVVGLARQLRKSEEAMQGYADAARCHMGDFMEYAALRRALSDAETDLSRSRAGSRRLEVARSLERLRPGDVIIVPAGRSAGAALVLDTGIAKRSDGPAPLVLLDSRQVKRLTLADFAAPAEPVEKVKIPKWFSPRNPQHRKDMAATLRAKVPHGDVKAARGGRGGGSEGDDAEINRIRTELRRHPCHGCDEREDHARWAERYFRLERESSGLRRRVESRSQVIARTFDRVCGVLEQLGYLKNGTVTEAGKRLSRIYSELDLLTAESLREGLWENLGAAELAACVSALVFESRQPDDATPPKIPPGTRDVLTSMVRLWGELENVEKDNQVAFQREPDLGFAWAAYRWTGGADLDDVLGEAGMTAGDFVRAVKQLMDLLGQIADAAGEGRVRTTARKAADAMRRGVIAYSSVA